MNLPVQITIRNLPHSAKTAQMIRKEAAKLDKFYSRIISCRAMVEAPEHHRHGNVYHVRLDIGVPGRELVIKHEPGLQKSIRQGGEERYTKHIPIGVPHQDVALAIRDAFRSARRRLQDYVRRQRGEIKVHNREDATGLAL